MDRSWEKWRILREVKEEGNILRTLKHRWIGHILRRNCHLKRVIQGKIKEKPRRQGGRRKQLLDDLKENKRYSSLKGSTMSYSAENSLWERLWTCPMTDCGMTAAWIPHIGRTLNPQFRWLKFQRKLTSTLYSQRDLNLIPTFRQWY